MVVNTITWEWRFKAKSSLNYRYSTTNQFPQTSLIRYISCKWELIIWFFCVLVTWIHKQLLLAGNFCYVTIISTVKDSVSQCSENPMLFQMWELNMLRHSIVFCFFSFMYKMFYEVRKRNISFWCFYSFHFTVLY